MMLTLHPHPAQKPIIPMTLQASVAWQSDDLLAEASVVFSFRCSCSVDERGAVGILLPEPTVAAECGNLWQHTCCEAFVAVPDTDDYLEFNFSPSGCWAVYRFNDYRVRDDTFRCAVAPKIEFTPHEQAFELTATVPSALFKSQWPGQTHWLIGLTAVIETTAGEKSYWALRHEGEKPDFHLRSQFLFPLHNQKIL